MELNVRVGHVDTCQTYKCLARSALLYMAFQIEIVSKIVIFPTRGNVELYSADGGQSVTMATLVIRARSSVIIIIPGDSENMYIIRIK